MTYNVFGGTLNLAKSIWGNILAVAHETFRKLDEVRAPVGVCYHLLYTHPGLPLRQPVSEYLWSHWWSHDKHVDKLLRSCAKARPYKQARSQPTVPVGSQISGRADPVDAPTYEQGLPVDLVVQRTDCHMYRAFHNTTVCPTWLTCSHHMYAWQRHETRHQFGSPPIKHVLSYK